VWKNSLIRSIYQVQSNISDGALEIN